MLCGLRFYRWSSNSVLRSSYKNTFVGAGNLQVITNKFWCENLWGPYVLYLGAQFCVYIVLVSKEVETYNLTSWLHEKELFC